MPGTNRSRPLALFILDGFALNPNPKGNAVLQARTPTFDRIWQKFPHTTLTTFGPAVGLPLNQMGNSEVGHLNIGGGRIVKQELTRINEAIESNTIISLKEFKELTQSLSSEPLSSEPSKTLHPKALHLIGLLSLGGVHSYLSHLQSLVESAVSSGVKTIFIHAITDGRDRPPNASIEDLKKFSDFLIDLKPRLPENTEIHIASIIGRYYAMDRDNRWDRTQLAYDLLTAGKGESFSDPLEAIKSRISSGTSDEFLEPIVINYHGSRSSNIQNGDSILFFNFRADRMRQLVKAFLYGKFSLKEEFSHFRRSCEPSLQRICTLTQYNSEFPVDVLFKPTFVEHHLGQVLAENGLKQLRIAETEKYAHVTYFFNGGLEIAYPGEERILIPSPKHVRTYDLAPEMSAIEVTDRLIEALKSNKFDVAIINFANCDMVGHTGNFDAAVKAVETVDTCLGRALETISQLGGLAIVTADHGNADQMIDYNSGLPHTFHTTYPVPFVIVSDAVKNLTLRHLTLRQGGALCDIAPTICDLLSLSKPTEMTGSSLITG